MVVGRKRPEHAGRHEVTSRSVQSSLQQVSGQSQLAMELTPKYHNQAWQGERMEQQRRKRPEALVSSVVECHG